MRLYQRLSSRQLGWLMGQPFRYFLRANGNRASFGRRVGQRLLDAQAVVPKPDFDSSDDRDDHDIANRGVRQEFDKTGRGERLTKAPFPRLDANIGSWNNKNG